MCEREKIQNRWIGEEEISHLHIIFFIFLFCGHHLLKKKLLHLSRPYNSLASTRAVLVVREVVVVLQANRMSERSCNIVWCVIFSVYFSSSADSSEKS